MKVDFTNFVENHFLQVNCKKCLSVRILNVDTNEIHDKKIRWSVYKDDELYGNLRKTTDIIKEQWMKFSGHCWRSKEETIHKLLLWEPLHGKRRPSKTYID